MKEFQERLQAFGFLLTQPLKDGREIYTNSMGVQLHVVHKRYEGRELLLYTPGRELRFLSSSDRI